MAAAAIGGISESMASGQLMAKTNGVAWRVNGVSAAHQLSWRQQWRKCQRNGEMAAASRGGINGGMAAAYQREENSWQQ
jgi:hypothetical protein